MTRRPTRSLLSKKRQSFYVLEEFVPSFSILVKIIQNPSEPNRRVRSLCYLSSNIQWSPSNFYQSISWL